jgi:hypothetical protein
MSKPRSDSKLKNLPEERQEQIIAWLNTQKTEEHPGGLAYAREQLAADGIKVSNSTLSAFWAYWDLRQDFSDADLAATFAEEQMRAFDPANAQKAEELGQFVFTSLAVRKKDPQTFVALQRLKLDKESAEFKGKIDLGKLQLSQAKFETETCKKFLLWFKEAKAREIADSGMSNADKIAALRAEYFKDVDALEASGGVHLPD